jgi:hypothetical protein
MKLIDDVKNWWRFWSIRLGAVGTAVTTVLIASPDAALFAWGLLPLDLRAAIPAQYVPLIGVGIFLGSMIARLVKQESLKREDDGRH